jgi:AraC-like DNA-binding protein
MTLILTEANWEELCQQSPVPRFSLLADDFESLAGVPEGLGRGFFRNVELASGIQVFFAQWEYDQDLIIKVPAHDHPIQIAIYPSGSVYFDAVHPTLGGRRSYLSGSGISPAVTEMLRGGERSTLVNIEIEPELFHAVFLTEQQRDSEALKPLFKGEDWKVSFYPIVTPAIQSIAQQMWQVPYQGVLKQIYLQAKVMELLVVYLDWLAADSQRTQTAGLKPDTIARLHHAREILTMQLENPPTLPQLAQQVGLSDRSLQRGFKALFHTTVVSYLIQQRLEQAAQILRQGHCTVAEVANRVGYGNVGHFSVAFKRRFGITPSQCLAGELADFE